MTTTTCDGCGKTLTRINSGEIYGPGPDGVTVEIAPDHVITVCAVNRFVAMTFRTTESTSNPKMPCLRRAWEKASVCPGCGANDANPFEGLCDACATLLARARTTLADEARPHCLDRYLVSSVYPSDDAGAAADALLELIVDVAAATGPRRRRDRGRGRVLTTDRSRASSGGHTGMPTVELDDGQAKAVVALGAAIRKLTDAMYAQGRKDGRDLLGTLARGELSVNDFNERVEKWADREAELEGDEP